ncbi:hypothetical protein [Streptomyces tanashiensis]|uniref:hypothetical protein n=1 Tax=Streptomyces tanashiensis TaxID=67367 RepID=UPI003442EB6D
MRPQADGLRPHRKADENVAAGHRTAFRLSGAIVALAAVVVAVGLRPERDALRTTARRESPERTVTV